LILSVRLLNNPRQSPIEAHGGSKTAPGNVTIADDDQRPAPGQETAPEKRSKTAQNEQRVETHGKAKENTTAGRLEGLEALLQYVSAGHGIKDFYKKSDGPGGDRDETTNTKEPKEFRALWENGKRRYKAHIGGLLVIDVDSISQFYELFPKRFMPSTLQDIEGGSFPCYVKSPSGHHLYFKYEGPDPGGKYFYFKKYPGLDIKYKPITPGGSSKPAERGKQGGDYILHGNIKNAPELYRTIERRLPYNQPDLAPVKSAADKPQRPKQNYTAAASGAKKAKLETIAGWAQDKAPAGRNNYAHEFAVIAGRPQYDYTREDVFQYLGDMIAPDFPAEELQAAINSGFKFNGK
jgi:hypothetical protein